MLYADVIIDISAAALDRTFQYRIPESLSGSVDVGSPVMIPFGTGNKVRKGYIVGIGNEPKFDPGRLKDIIGPAPKDLSIEERFMMRSERCFLSERRSRSSRNGSYGEP